MERGNENVLTLSHYVVCLCYMTTNNNFIYCTYNIIHDMSIMSKSIILQFDTLQKI